MEVLRSVLGSTTELSPFGFALRTVFVGFLLWAEGKVLPHRSGGQFAGYDFVFFWMMGGITAAPLFDPESSFLSRLMSLTRPFPRNRRFHLSHTHIDSSLPLALLHQLLNPLL
jgi:hypothetical protein